MARLKVALLLTMAAALLPCLPAAAAGSRAPECDRACLRGVLDQYLAAVFAHDPARAPLAADIRTTQNATTTSGAEGIWKTASGYGPVQRRFADPAHGEVAYYGLLREGNAEDIVSLRLKVEQRKVTEAEWTIARAAYGGMFSAAGLAAMPPPSDAPIARNERTPRAEMIAAANAYFEGLQRHDGSAVPHVPGCERVENGFRVTHRVMPVRRPGARPGAPGAAAAAGTGTTAVPNVAQENRSGDCVAGFEGFEHSILATTQRRFPVVDEAAGVVMGTTLFQRPPESTMKRNLLTEYFFIRRGKIAAIYAAMYYLDPGAPDTSGWPAGGGAGNGRGLQTFATTPVNGLEGLTMTAGGTLYVTNAATHELLKVSASGQVTTFAKLPTVPQVVLPDGEDFVLTSQVEDPHFAAARPGEPRRMPTLHYMGSLKARALLLDHSGRVIRTIAGPPGAFFNGLARFGANYLIADSTAGTIWLLDVRHGTVQRWLSDPALQPVNGRFPGANGIKVVGDTVYVANTSAGALYRIRSSDGRPSGRPMLLAHVRGADDFAVAADGTVYIPSAGAVLKVSPDGAIATLAQGCGGCDSAMLADHERTLYLVTHGFGAGAGPGTIYRLALGG